MMTSKRFHANSKRDAIVSYEASEAFSDDADWAALSRKLGTTWPLPAQKVARSPLMQTPCKATSRLQSLRSGLTTVRDGKIQECTTI